MRTSSTERLFEQACYLARDREQTTTATDKNGKKKPVELYTAGLYYDTCGYISYDEYVLVIDLLDGSKTVYDGYHNCFCDYIPGTRVVIDEDKEMPVFSSNLVRLMEESGVTDAVLADAARDHIATIHKYMDGKRLPTYERLLRICGALRCFVTDLTLPH